MWRNIDNTFFFTDGFSCTNEELSLIFSHDWKDLIIVILGMINMPLFDGSEANPYILFRMVQAIVTMKLLLEKKFPICWNFQNVGTCQEPSVLSHNGP